MASLDLPKYTKKNTNYICENCDFICSREIDMSRHCTTRKHSKTYAYLQLTCDNYQCECGKKYKHRQSLHKHKKSCVLLINANQTTIVVSKPTITNEVVVDLINENKELRQMLLEQNNKIIEIAKEGKYITHNTTNNTTNNFSVSVFLKEQCKDAIDIMDFVSSLKLQLNDLEETARLGYVEGISKIFIRAIRELDVYKRPIHCSDLKRETLYIKDKNSWEKEDKDKTKLKKAITMVSSKNIQQIPNWVEQNPQCKDTNSKKNDEYMALILNTMNGTTIEEQNDNINKVIKNVSKEVIIDKNTL